MTAQSKPVTDLFSRLAAHWPEKAGRIQAAAVLLYRARDLLLADLEQVLAEFGMRPADLDVLVALRTSPPPMQLTPTELYRSLLLSSGGLTKILYRLEDAGWVERPANPADGRSRLVQLTRRGKAQVEDVMESVIAHERAWLAPLTEAEQVQLTTLLGKLVAGAEG